MKKIAILLIIVVSVIGNKRQIYAEPLWEIVNEEDQGIETLDDSYEWSK